jgi:hypothetical protein
MPALNPDIISAAFKGLPANLLSPLTSALDGEGAGTGPFSSLLSKIAAAEKQSASPAASNTPAQNTSPVASSSSQPFPDTSALRKVLNYIRAQEKAAQQNNKQPSQGNAVSSASAANNSNASSNTSTQNTSTSTQSSSSADDSDTSSAASSDGSSDASSDTTADPSKPPDPQTLALALTQMQQLMQWLAQNLTSALPTAGAVPSAAAITGALSPTPTSDPTSGTVPDPTSATGSNTVPVQDPTQSDPTQNASDPTGAADGSAQLAEALSAFLALMQTIEVQLITSANAKAPAATAANASTTTDTSNTATANTLPNISPYAQIKAGLEKLEAALEAAITGNTKADAADGVNATTDNSSTPAASSSAASATTSVKTSNIDELMASINPASPTEAHLFKLFADMFGNAAQAAASTVSNNLTVTAQGAGDAGIGGDQNGNNGSTSGNTAAFNNNDPSALLANGAQPSNNLLNFANQLSATHAGTNPALPSPIIDQVILSLNRGIKNGDSQMTIQLQPGDLGRINVKLDISSDGKVQGTVVADNPHTLDQLLKDVRGLERALQDAGLRADPGSLQFSLGNQQQPGNTFAQSQGSSSSGSSSNGDGSSIDPLSSAIALPADAEIYYITPGGVNIKV